MSGGGGGGGEGPPPKRMKPSGSFQAFAAMLVDGQVVTWGSAESGGDCGDLQLLSAHGQNRT